MDENNTQNISVLIVNQALEAKGIIANAAFVIGLTAGRQMPAATFGDTVYDGDLSPHSYLTNIGHMVRKAGQSKIRTIREALINEDSVKIVDYTESAAPSSYDAYEEAIGQLKGEAIEYRAIHLYGPLDIVGPLTKNLSRLE